MFFYSFCIASAISHCRDEVKIPLAFFRPNKFIKRRHLIVVLPPTRLTELIFDIVVAPVAEMVGIFRLRHSAKDETILS